MKKQVVLTVALAGALSMAGPVRASAMHVRKNLTATTKAPDARGHATLVVQGSKGSLDVRGHGLDGDSTFEVIVDTVRIGTLTTDGNGTGKARFTTSAHGQDQLLGTDPSGKLLEVRDEEGDDVLETEMPEDTQPGDTQCCVSDGDETECEVMSPDACTAAGGTDAGAGSCMPDPCSTTPGTEEADNIQCCKAQHDQNGPECELASATECADKGGTNVGAGTCDPDPCSATPPADGEIACCVPDGEADAGASGDGGAHCERTTSDACDALGGTSNGDVACDPDPCGAPPETTTTTTPP